ncbi:hypothetical protein JHK86_056899 [Glycine max]|nr:hypothetical protein JHK86_056899 [Glycine max]
MWMHHMDIMQDLLEERCNFTLCLLKHHRHAFVSPYLTYVTSRVEEFERVSRAKALHQQLCRFWLLRIGDIPDGLVRRMSERVQSEILCVNGKPESSVDFGDVWTTEMDLDIHYKFISV